MIPLLSGVTSNKLLRMHKFDLENSTLFESFEGLYIEDVVYSQKFGLGQVRGFYNDEIIVQFSNSRKRFSIEDKEIRKVPDDYLRQRGAKVKIVYEGEKMSHSQYKKKAGLTKKQTKEEKLKHIMLKETLEILGISRATLNNAIVVNNIKTRTFGRNVMIHRDDLLRLYKKIGKDR